MLNTLDFEQTVDIDSIDNAAVDSQADNAAVVTPSTVESQNDALTYLPTKLIKPFSLGGNNRRTRPSSDFNSLCDDISKKGILQNLVVREVGKDDYELIAGYGRFDAAVKLGIEQVPVVIKRNMSDKEALEAQLAENLQRSDLKIGDHVVLTKKYLSLSGGCHKTASAKLGYSESVYRDYLQLSKCDEKLIDALDDNDKPVKKGHCLILSVFPVEIQLKTLESILADPDKYSVAYLKAQSSKFELRLSEAKFDLTECDVCPHNTNQQFNVFESNTEDKCSNAICYMKKQDEWLNDVRIPQLEEDHGMVLTTMQKPLSDVNRIDVKVVGEEQAKACTSDCQKCVVLVSCDTDTFGRAVPNMCIDTDCFKEKLEANKEPEPVVESSPEQNTDAQEEGSQPTTTAKKQTGKSKATVKSISKKISRYYANDLQKLASANVMKGTSFASAILVKSVSNVLRDSSSKVSLSVAELATKDVAELNTMLTGLLTQLCQQEVKDSGSDHSDFDANKMLRSTFIALNDEDTLIEKAIQNWTPTTELLSMHTKTQLAIMAAESGFEAAYDQKHGEAAWSKFSSTNKLGEIAKEMLSIEYDYTDYAPESYIQMALEYKPVD